jgi:Ser/Thr protein kinase RdoA (MazF antagonist)
MVRREGGKLSAREVCSFVREFYSLDAAAAEPVERATNEVWQVRGIFGAFAFKRFPASARQAALREPGLVAHLRSMGVPTAIYTTANDGSFVIDAQGQPAHLQTYVDGVTVKQNRAPPWLMVASAEMLGRICTALAGVRGLPDGFPAKWFSFDVRRKTLEYDALIIAASRNRRLTSAQRREVTDDLVFKRAAVAEIATIKLAARMFTRGATHGDYSIRQVLLNGQQIAAVVDWSSACRQPYMWDVLRSYSYADPACADGHLDIDGVRRYVGAFMNSVSLTRRDLAAGPDLYYAQQLRSTYGYRQVLLEGNPSAELLRFAHWRTRLCRWLQKHRGDVSDALRELAPARS